MVRTRCAGSRDAELDGIKFDTQPAGPNWNITVSAACAPRAAEWCWKTARQAPDGTPLKGSTHRSIDILHHPDQCPFEFYRVGGDNSPRWVNGMQHALVDAVPFLEVHAPTPASRPGCWAYLDMLAIGRGVMQQGWVQKGCPELRFEEERTLFATWAIVSSPLVLSFDVTNDTEVARLWPIIGNEQALRINAQWAGEAGHLLKQSEESFNATDCGAGDMEVDAGKITLPLWAVWAKRLTDPQNGVAVLAINVGDTAQSITITFDELLSELARIDPDLAVARLRPS